MLSAKLFRPKMKKFLISVPQLVKCFTKFFEVIRHSLDAFASFSRFSKVFGPVGTCWDVLRCFRMDLEAPERFQETPELFWIFEMVFDSFGHDGFSKEIGQKFYPTRSSPV